MVYITFSVFKDKILSGEKKQTIRKYSEGRYKQLCNAKKYQLYWGSPRKGGELLKEVEPLEKPFIIVFDVAFCSHDNEPEKDHLIIDKIESEYTFINLNKELIAISDGFSSVQSMWDWFYQMYGENMYKEKFMVIRWK